MKHIKELVFALTRSTEMLLNAYEELNDETYLDTANAVTKAYVLLIRELQSHSEKPSHIH